MGRSVSEYEELSLVRQHRQLGGNMSPNSFIDKEELLFNNRIWRVNDVANYLSCSVGHVYNLVSENRIPKRKKGKFLYFVPSEIHEWILEGE